MANATNETSSAPQPAAAEAPTEKQSSNKNQSIEDVSHFGPSVSTKQVRYSFQKKPFVIGVAGGTASGKSTVCSKIMEKLGPLDPTSVYLSHEKRVICLSQDSFYRKLSEEERALVAKGNFNFDHPSAFDVNLLVNTLREVQNGRMVKVPIYNYMENEIGDTEQVIYPADVVLMEGLLLFYFPEVREMFHMKIFVDTDPDTRLSRRVMRDVNERHRGLDVVLSQYTKFVKPSFEEFCLPTKKYADIIVPRGPDNEVAVDLIVTHVQSIFDPSIRHQSIKYYDEPKRSGTKSARGSKKTRSKELPKNGLLDADPFRDPVVASVVNGKCVTPTLTNGSYSNGEALSVVIPRSEPIQINSGHHSPLLRNGFNSSSAPSHLNGLANGFDAHQWQNGFSNGLNGVISSEDEDLVVLANGSSAQSSQSPRTQPLPTPFGKVTKSGSGKPTGNSSQPKAAQQQPAAPILLVASR